MALPIKVKVRGEVVTSAGPQAGRLVWTRDVPLRPADTTDDDLAIPEEIVTNVGDSGVFEQELYANNDPASSPTGWTWHVRTHFPNWKTSFDIVVPFDAVDGIVNFNQLTPVPEDGTGELYALVNHVHEGGGGGGDGPSPSNTVASETGYGQGATAGNATTYSRGNHTHGTPALPTAAAIGAATSGHAHDGAYDPAGSASSAASAAAAALAAHEADTTAIHGIANTANLIVEGDARLTNPRTPTAHALTHADGGSDEISLDGSQITSGTVPIARVPTGTSGTTVALGNHTHTGVYEPAGAVATHEADTTNVHGIADTTVLATDAEVAAAVSAHSADTTAVHGIADTSVLATDAEVAAAVSAHVALADPHTQYARILTSTGSGYTVSTTAEIYIGPDDPGSVPAGSLWIDTDA